MRIYDMPPYRNERVKPKNIWHQSIANWLSSSLSDIYNDKEKLTQCYSPSRIHQYDENEYPSIIYEYINNFNNGNSPREVFIVYAPPGTGKTTYLANILSNQNIYRKEIPYTIFPLIYDLRNESAFDDLSTKFTIWLDNQLISRQRLNIFRYTNDIEGKLEIYVDIFKEKLKRQIIGYNGENIKEISEDVELVRKITNILEERYLTNDKLLNTSILEYLYEKQKIKIVVVLDNFDHFDEAHKTHQYVYALAREVLSLYNCPVFLPMRNYTLQDSYDLYGYKEADAARSKLLSPLIHNDLLKKRVEYIIDNIDKSISYSHEAQKISISKSVVKVEIDTVLNGIINSTRINRFLSGISGDNIRIYLDVIKQALQSGHIQYFRDQHNNAQTPYKYFLKACFYCNNMVYFPSDSRTPIINIYDNNYTSGSRNTLIRIRILQLLNHHDATLKVSEIIELLKKFGYRGDCIRSAILIFIKAGLIKQKPYYTVNSDIIKDEFQYKISQVGKYYIEELIFDLYYFELMSPSINLPRHIYNEAIQLVSLGDSSKRAHDIRRRSLNNIANFVSTCEDEEKKILQENSTISFNDIFTPVSHYILKSIKNTI